MLSSSLLQRNKYEKYIYETWKKPLDLLECLIHVTSESGEQQQAKFKISHNTTTYSKKIATLKIHARALLISKELLTLLKAGYTDGAIARWRSLHELAMISIFLCENNDEVSQRYLDYEIVEKFKAATEYREIYRNKYKKLGYNPIPKKKNSIHYAKRRKHSVQDMLMGSRRNMAGSRVLY